MFIILSASHRLSRFIKTKFIFFIRNFTGNGTFPINEKRQKKAIIVFFSATTFY